MDRLGQPRPLAFRRNTKGGPKGKVDVSTQGCIEGVGGVLEVLKTGLYRVRMPNGHEITAFWGKKEANLVDSLTEGKQVCVSLTPFDMSKGRILRIFKGLQEEARSLRRDD